MKPGLTRRMFLGTATLAVRSAAAQNGDPRIARVEWDLEQLRQRYKIPGLSAAILSEERVRWSKGFGSQDREQQIAATPDTPYRIASLTKTFASTLLMQLFEQGKLNLEEPIQKYVPAGGPLAEQLNRPDIKIRHVLSHTSHGTPGEAYSYSGFRFSSLTFVIEQLSGKPFRELLAERILDPLDMSRSVPGQDADAPRYQAVLQQLAKPYKLDAAGEIVPAEYPPRRINASAGLISTARDLALYDAAIDRHKLMKRETQKKAWTPTVANDGSTLPYALGWFVQRHKGTRLIWHYGFWPGSFSALYLKLPERRVTMFLLANSDGLSSPFRLGAGDVTASAFAQLFLDFHNV